MKNIKILTLLFAVSLNFISCDSKLEEIQPEDSLFAGSIFADFTLIEATTLGIYDGFQDAGIVGGLPEFIGDFMADDVSFVGSFTTLQDLRDYTAEATNGSVDNIWFDVFDVVRDANNIIVNLPNVGAESVSFPDTNSATNFESLKTQFIAEARFCRALANFIGVNLFAQPFQVSNGSNLGLPIVEEFFEGDISLFQKTRSTLNETHSFIENDLIFAMNNLPVSNGDRASSTSASALLARLYLYREQWTDAANMANNAINATGFSLATDYSFYNNSSTEHIFQVINLADDASFDSSFDTFYNSTADNGRGDLVFTQNLIDVYTAEAGDLRYTTLSDDDTDAGNNTSRFTLKYPNGQNNDSDPNVIRISEMYLTRAEANFRAGSAIGDTPINDVNRTRTRAGLPALTGTITLDDILVERRKELAFEGFRRMDLLRNRRNLRPDNGAVSAFGANRTILPLPDDELNNNPNIRDQQNPGY